MTILPKKKPAKSTKEKQDSESDSEAQARSSPRQNWTSGTPEREDPVVETRKFPVAEASSGTRRRKRCESKEQEKKQQETEYNSGDEYERNATGSGSGRSGRRYTLEDEIHFEKELKEKRGFIIKKMSEDGACLFRAVADQVYGDQEMHQSVRQQCMDYMMKNRDYFSQYVTEDFTAYVNRKRSDHCHGNHLEIQAMSELFNRVIQVYHYSTEPINIFHGGYGTDNAPMRVSYHQDMHYNSVVDPFAATIGVGLGLAGYQPGLADRMLMEQSLKTSELDIIEQTMLEDKIHATDWEATSEALEEAVARESYYEWLRENEKRARAKCSERAEASASSDSSVVSKLPLPVAAAGSSKSSTSLPLELEAKALGAQPRQKPPAASAAAPPNCTSASPGSLQSFPSNSGAARTRGDGMAVRHRRSLSRSPRHSPYSRSPVNSPQESPDQSPLPSPLQSPTIKSPVSSPCQSPCLSARSSPQPAVQSRSRSKLPVMSTASATPEACASASSVIDSQSEGLSARSAYHDFIANVPPTALGLHEWEDDQILAAVLVASQQDYLDSLKKGKVQNSDKKSS
jgi:hypothetical protein